jgi:hypothetical protein
MMSSVLIVRKILFFLCLILQGFQQLDYIAPNDRVDERQSGKDLEGNSCSLIEALFRNLPGGTEEKPQRT